LLGILKDFLCGMDLDLEFDVDLGFGDWKKKIGFEREKNKKGIETWL